MHGMSFDSPNIKDKNLCLMKARHTFARTSFLVICTLLVSFAFIKEFGFNQPERTKEEYLPSKILKDSYLFGNKESLITVKFFNKEDELVYKTQVDLGNTNRDRDEKLAQLLAKSDLILKVDNELYFRTN